ncbi:MAG: ChaN family lipoprotein [Marinobacter sp.]|nr:ChaN family lipoprotein [Marinobacter sp.]
MNALPLTVLLLTYLLLAGCTSLPNHRTQVLPPQTQYDAIITNGRGSVLSINQLASQLRSADVIVIGEYHGHHGAHLLQSLLQSALYQQHPQQVLTMEQFTLEDQHELDLYLAGKTGESEFIADADAWPNYKASYRPLMEFSRARKIPVIAANAPADTVRCIGRNGEGYLNSLEMAERNQLPESPFVDTPAYREKFFDTLGTGHSSDTDARLENSYKAQLLRDNTMADQVIKAIRDYPGHQAIHLTGTFHAENHLGMVAVLEKKRPDLSVAVISPAFWQPGDDFLGLIETHQQKGDFLYFLQPLPQEYTDNERHRNAIMEQFRHAADISCD